jgi:hypothetical protein
MDLSAPGFHCQLGSFVRQDLKRLLDDGTLAFADQATRVYRLTGTPEDPDTDPLRAAWLQLGAAKSWHERTATTPDAIISHRSAAHLRGLGDLIPQEHEFYTNTRLRPRRADIKVRVRPHLANGSWEIWGGLPVRTVSALLDDLLTDREDESAVAQVVQDALRSGLLARDTLDAIVTPPTTAYGRPAPEAFARVLAGEAATK